MARRTLQGVIFHCAFPLPRLLQSIRIPWVLTVRQLNAATVESMLEAREVDARASRNLEVFSMPSKALPKKKHASLPGSSSFTSQFHKGWTRLSHSGRHHLTRPK